MTPEQFQRGRQSLIDEAQRKGGFECTCCGSWAHIVAAVGRYESHTPGQPGVVYTDPSEDQLREMESRFLRNEDWLKLSTPGGAKS